MNASQDISDLLTRLLHAVDDRDWSRIRSCFGERVETDYSSLFGGAAETLASDDLISRWRDFLPGFDKTQHLTGPVLVTLQSKDRAEARTAVRGYHFMANASGGAVWMVAGHYRLRTVQQDGIWVITALTLETAYQDGNLDLPRIAAERAVHGK